MSHQLLGVVIAVGASALYGLAVGLQALEARRIPSRHVLRLSLLGRLARRPLWITGALLGTAGWLLQAVALSVAPLTIVEPTLATSLVILLVIGARALGEPVGVREVVSTLAVAAGVAGLGVGAPSHSASHVSGAGLVFGLACLGAIVAAPHLVRGGRSSGVLIAISAGVAYAFVGLSTKFAADDISASAWRGALVWLVLLGAVAVVGVLSEMSAFQLRPVTQVAPIVFGLNVVVPVALAPVLAHESWSLSNAARAGLVLSVTAVVLGSVGLSRSDAVAAVLVSETGGAETHSSLESAALQGNA